MSETKYAYLRRDNLVHSVVVYRAAQDLWEDYIPDAGTSNNARQLVDLLNADLAVPPTEAPVTNVLNVNIPEKPSPFFHWNGEESFALQEFLGAQFAGYKNENVSGQFEDKIWVGVFNGEETFDYTNPGYFVRLPDNRIVFITDLA